MCLYLFFRKVDTHAILWYIFCHDCDNDLRFCLVPVMSARNTHATKSNEFLNVCHKHDQWKSENEWKEELLHQCAQAITNQLLYTERIKTDRKIDNSIIPFMDLLHCWNCGCLLGQPTPKWQDDNYEQRYGDEEKRRKKDKNKGEKHNRNSVRRWTNAQLRLNTNPESNSAPSWLCKGTHRVNTANLCLPWKEKNKRVCDRQHLIHT